MKQRCQNPNNEKYPQYGQRGICVCEQWKDFAVFYEWAYDNGYHEGLSIDRINPDGNYEPSNCRWADAKTQQNNRTNNKFITVCSITKTLSEWSKILGISDTALRGRLKRGRDLETMLQQAGVIAGDIDAAQSLSK